MLFQTLLRSIQKDDSNIKLENLSDDLKMIINIINSVQIKHILYNGSLILSKKGSADAEVFFSLS